MSDGSSTAATDANALQAALLLQRHTVDAVILTGRCSYRQKPPPRTEAQNMAAVLERKGITVEPPMVLLDELATETVANFLNAQSLLRAYKPVTTIHIVCLPFTGFRAKYIARMIFGDSFRFQIAKSYYHPPLPERLKLLFKEVRNYVFMRVIWFGLRSSNRQALLARLKRWHPAY